MVSAEISVPAEEKKTLQLSGSGFRVEDFRLQLLGSGFRLQVFRPLPENLEGDIGSVSKDTKKRPDTHVSGDSAEKTLQTHMFRA